MNDRTLGAAHGLVSGPQIRARTRRDLARQRRQRRHQCWDHLIAAPLWPMHEGASLNVAVAGSLVLYRLAGFL